MKFTKEEVIGVAFSKLKPKSDEVFADVGAGSGAVTEFFSPYVRKVYAVEIDEAACEGLRKRFKGNEKVEVLNMNGKDFFENYECDKAFIGGTKNLEEMIEVCNAKKVVISAARVEVAVKALKCLKKKEAFEEVVIVNISKSYELAGGTAFKNLNPVFLVVGCFTG
ncbi:ribosomal RNA adenine methylase transferase [Ferroglobus placidus DSM 10642]|uniref:Ribosomal RNA adenine methylase transferase n=1 Tax=Ferroglobus placidus (strain DSM 10642 / AEDII12DO) TaxID=589924 RepID=D3S1D3_FERPA|nr:rRNA adenine N-6-methyltransferase family protein [Ferroglobus placidus]ADC66397.1 ribosomal RNA adenine methylase transferase [Ferroglobus placidus DSM 10642]